MPWWARRELGWITDKGSSPHVYLYIPHHKSMTTSGWQTAERQNHKLGGIPCGLVIRPVAAWR